jgi:hypothetical protein
MAPLATQTLPPNRARASLEDIKEYFIILTAWSCCPGWAMGQGFAALPRPEPG